MSDQNEMMTFCRGPHKHHPSKIYFNWQSSFSGEDIFYIGQSETRMLSVNQNQKQTKRNFVEDLLSIGFNWPSSFRRLKCKKLTDDKQSDDKSSQGQVS